MMVHHDNPHRPFTSSSSSSKYGGDGDVDVPPGTNGRFYSSGGAVNGGLGVGVGGGTTAESRPPQHPPFQTVVSSSSFSGMGCPFTQAQWRELERQAMIYKYMVASVPVPPNLLFPLPSLPGSHYSLAGGSYSLRFGNCGGDPEPGRCRRTDGKKWRCSRDAAPDQKYCERHLNRGRPRSRKPVEVSTASVSPNKKTRHCNGSNAPLTSTSSAAFNSATKPHGHHSNQAPLMFLHGNRGLEPVAVADNKDAKGLDWLMIGEPHRADETLSLNSNYTTTKADRFNEYLFPVNNSDMISLAESRTITPRGFIDAWSDNGSNQSCAVSPHGQKLSLSEEIGHIHMGLGVSRWAPNSDGGSGSWIYPEPGGPLGEVFRPAINTVSSPLSPSSAALQGKMASVSDSSGGSSPTHGSSVGRSEMTLRWFNS